MVLCRAMVPDAIKAAMSQSIVASGDDGQNAETGTSANQFSPAKVPEDRVCATSHTLHPHCMNI